MDKTKRDRRKKLKEKGVNEQHINELRKLDLELFNANRRFTRKQIVLSDDFFDSIADTYNYKSIMTLSELLDELENEALYEIIKNSDLIKQRIIELKYQGYPVKEISSILALSVDSIYRKIKKIKKVTKTRKNKLCFWSIKCRGI